MNKNIMIAIAAVIVLGGGIWWIMSGDQYSAATTPEDCAKCEPAGKWIKGPTCLNRSGGIDCTPVPGSEMTQEICDTRCKEGSTYELVENHCEPPAK